MDVNLKKEENRMRKFFVLAIAAAFAASVCAQPAIQEGTRELIVEGGWDPDGASGTELDLTVGYGVFVRDAIEVGGLLGYTSYEDAYGAGSDWKVLAIGGFAEYHFDMASMTVPYIGAEVGYTSYEAGSLDDSTFVYGPKVGVKYFITDNVAVDVALTYMLAGEDIFVNDGILEDNDLSLSFGIRAMF